MGKGKGMLNGQLLGKVTAAPKSWMLMSHKRALLARFTPRQVFLTSTFRIV